MLEFLKRVVLSTASREIREDALNMLIREASGARKVGEYEVSASCFNEIMISLEMGKKINAIKILRNETKADLLNAKNAVYQFAEEKGFK